MATTTTRRPARTAAVVQAEFDAFKKRVVEVAAEAKVEYDFCDEIDRMLEDMGLEMPTKSATITIELPDLAQYEEHQGESLNEAALERAIRYSMGMEYGDVEGTVKATITSKG